MDSGGGCDEMPALIRRHFALLQHQILLKKRLVFHIAHYGCN
jgi:hypothetical protein